MSAEICGVLLTSDADVFPIIFETEDGSALGWSTQYYLQLYYSWCTNTVFDSTNRS